MTDQSTCRPNRRYIKASLGWLLALSAIILVVTSSEVGVIGSDQGHGPYGSDDLSPEERKVIEYLQNEWRKDDSVTSVEIAMEAAGVPPSDDLRFKIGNYIKTHPELHAVIRQWGWVTLVLTPNEKLLARGLINAVRAHEKTPSLAELAKAVGIPEVEALRGLQMLQRFEILNRDESAGGVGYTVASRYLTWEPRLDFLFHSVMLSSGRNFNTN